MSQNLMKFLSELAVSPEKHTSYLENPDETMKQAGLDADESAALKSGDPARVNAILSRQVGSTEPAAGDPTSHGPGTLPTCVVKIETPPTCIVHTHVSPAGVNAPLSLSAEHDQVISVGVTPSRLPTCVVQFQVLPAGEQEPPPKS